MHPNQTVLSLVCALVICLDNGTVVGENIPIFYEFYEMNF